MSGIESRRFERFGSACQASDTFVPRRAWTANAGETLLLVEDEDELRGAVAELLAGAGYRVLQARSGEEASGVVAQSPDAIDLLVTDVLLPDMRGPEVAARVRAARPGTRVIYTTGNAPFRPAATPGLPSRTPCLEKPFTIQELGCLVRDVLDRRAE